MSGLIRRALIPTQRRRLRPVTRSVPAERVDAATQRRHLPRMSITVIVENDTIRLPIHVPDGTSVEVVLPGERGAIGEMAGADLAEYRQRVMEARRRFVVSVVSPSASMVHPPRLE